MDIKFDIPNVKDFEDLQRLIEQKKIKLILFTETHGFIEESQIQEKILEKLDFESFLYELLENKKIVFKEDFEKYLNEKDEKEFSIISKYGELKPTISLAKKFNLPLVGCDLKNTGRKNTDFRTKKDWSEKDLEKEEILFQKREKKQKEIIDLYLKKGSVFASIGAYHLRPESHLMKSLKGKHFIIFYPKLKGNKKFGETMNFKKEDVFFQVKLGEEYIKNEA